MLVAPRTGNSLSKLANALTESPVLMAAKATMRNGRPLVVAISTNDALGLNAQNLAKLLAAKNVYFVPFGRGLARDEAEFSRIENGTHTGDVLGSHAWKTNSTVSG